MIKEVSLCSGIGGFSLGFEWAKFAEPVMFCDFDEWCRKVLKKNWNDIPIYNDVKEIANDPRRFISNKINKGEKWVLTSGYPCQPFSVSGNRRGEEDPRHIFPYIHRIIEQTRPTYCVFENVYGHVSMGLDEVLFEMERINYHTRQFVVSASSVGARHKRDRLWIICKNVGDTEYNGCSTSEIRGSNQEIARGAQKGSEETKQLKGTSGQEDNGSLRNELPNSNNERVRSCLGGNDIDFQKESGERRTDGTRSSSDDERSDSSTTSNEGMEIPNTECRSSETQLQRESRILQEETEGRQTSGLSSQDIPRGGRRQTQCELDRVANGLSYWMDEPRGVPRVTVDQKNRAQRLKMLGNAIVPQIAMQIGLALKEDMKND
jgi:DNA (cytosine-5)-methyltransferase 1